MKALISSVILLLSFQLNIESRADSFNSSNEENLNFQKIIIDIHKDVIFKNTSILLNRVSYLKYVNTLLDAMTESVELLNKKEESQLEKIRQLKSIAENYHKNKNNTNDLNHATLRSELMENTTIHYSETYYFYSDAFFSKDGLKILGKHVIKEAISDLLIGKYLMEKFNPGKYWVKINRTALLRSPLKDHIHVMVQIEKRIINASTKQLGKSIFKAGFKYGMGPNDVEKAPLYTTKYEPLKSTPLGELKSFDCEKTPLPDFENANLASLTSCSPLGKLTPVASEVKISNSSFTSNFFEVPDVRDSDPVKPNYSPTLNKLSSGGF